MEDPVLKYTDLEKTCTLCTDATKYVLASVLIQAYTYNIDGKEKTILHPITYMSH